MAVRLVATMPGHGWVVPRLAELREMFPRLRVVADLRGPTGVLAYALQEAVRPKRQLTAVTLPQWLAACAGLYTGVRDMTVEHGAQRELDDSVAAAEKRTVGDRWAWERYGSDASQLEAATLAVWGVTNTQKTSAYEGRGVMTV